MSEIWQANWRQRWPSLAKAAACDGLLPWTQVFLPPGADLLEQLRRFRRNGINHVSITAAAGVDGATEALARLGHLRRLLEADPETRVVSDVAAARKAVEEGRQTIAFHFQCSTPFAADLDLVDAFRAMGIHRAILAYNEANLFADGCHEPRNAGLSAAGRRLIRRMDGVGMRIDLSHCGARTTIDVLNEDLSRAPIFSHSNARSLFDHERNITDEQIRLCASRGGYIGVNGVGMFLGAGQAALPRAIARHAAHIAEIAGPDHVGLGLDFMFLEGSDYGFYHDAAHRWPRGYPEPPWDFFQPEQFEDLIEELEQVGFSLTEIEGLIGENYLKRAF